jgi:hypothetical protein
VVLLPKFFLFLLAIHIMLFHSANADPFFLDDSLHGRDQINLNTKGLVQRSQAIDPTKKTLVLILDGQSQFTPVAPTAYTPVNAAAIDQFNIYDGASYEPTSPTLGQAYVPMAPYGPGHIGYRIADKFLTNGIFDRIILVFTAIGGSTYTDHTTGPLKDRNVVAMRRLASRGIVPGMTGVTFGYVLGLGETDNSLGTNQATATAGLNGIVSILLGAGYSGRIFITKETYAGGVVSPAIQAAQASMWNGTTIFSGGDLDSLGSSYRNTDNLHWNDAGILAAGDIVFNAMHASGAPF